MVAFFVARPSKSCSPLMAAPSIEVLVKPKSPRPRSQLMMFETPPPELLVTEIVFFDHISESVLPRANQFPPGGPAENLSCSGQPSLEAASANAGAAAKANRETNNSKNANFLTTITVLSDIFDLSVIFNDVTPASKNISHRFNKVNNT